jgi:hypothetical protein
MPEIMAARASQFQAARGYVARRGDGRVAPVGETRATCAPLRPRRFALGLLLATLVGGALRLEVAARAHPVELLGDEVYYVEVATHLARGEGHVYVGGLEGAARAWRPPGHAFLLSLLLDPARAQRDDPVHDPEQRLPLVRLEVAIGTLLVAATGLLGAALFGGRAGLLAAALGALQPALVAQSHMLWSEGLFSLLVTLSLAAAVRAAGSAPSPAAAAVAGSDLAWAAAAGLGFGLAALVRELALGVAAACALWWLVPGPGTAPPRGGRRTAARRGALMLVLAALVVAPWTLRNARVLGRFVPVSTVGWFALAEGNSLEHPDWLLPDGPEQRRFHAGYFTRRDELLRLDYARAHALARIAAEQPLWLARKAVRNLALLLHPDEVLRTKVRRGAYGDLPPPEIRALLAATAPAWIALFCAAAIGVAAAGADGRQRLLLLVLGGVAAAHVLANATPRFRLPWLPILCVAASHALLSGRGLPRRLGRGGALGAAAALGFFLGVCVPYFAIYGGR